MKLFKGRLPSRPFGAWLAAILAALAYFAVTPHAAATIYLVDRSFAGSGGSAHLTGTLEIPLGNYTIMNQGASPFLAVNLMLEVNGTSYLLNQALTGIILGTGRFFINATPTTLTFNTANADGFNPADLVFSDNSNPEANNRYTIGYDAALGFEVAYTGSGSVVASATFPSVFGTAVPEPTAGVFILLAFGLGSIRYMRRLR
jgi:hypothetical protein